ncbi:MAG: hypothetical protein JO058_09615, partial [Alphaproteobacteria bacterium]|nr:hypothetical protein [Alphaproteobacteria bacterium]
MACQGWPGPEFRSSRLILVIASYLPHLDDLAGPAVTWGVGLVLAFAGTGLAGRRFGIECRMIAGWG